jgi:cystathionine beta-lyase
MRYDFDESVDRRGSDSVKWTHYPGDVLPLWVADMDFRSPQPVIEALRERAEHGIFGYSRPSPGLTRALRARLAKLYGWEVAEPDVVYLPGIVTGLNVAIQAFTAPGEGVLAQPPVYFHLLRDPVQHGRVLADPPLAPSGDGYEIDFERFERAITPETRLFLLCNPHNPVGRVWTRAELETLAEICLRHRLVLCSDEIHCELLYPPHRHIPIATLDREVADRTVTLMAPSKTYNIAGLDCGFAVIPNPRLRRRWMEVSAGIVPWVNIMGHTAALAALSEGEEWLGQALAYLRANRDFLSGFLPREIPRVRMCRVEATYLAWLDCSAAGVTGKLSEFFLERGRVALSDGTDFGKGGEGFVRLNFACPREKLAEALRRMKKALEIS